MWWQERKERNRNAHLPHFHHHSQRARHWQARRRRARQRVEAPENGNRPLLHRHGRALRHHRIRADHVNTGNISGVHYVDGDGDRVSVAHSRGYHRDDKTFIEDGTVYCSWAPYGADIAELIARNLAGPAWTGDAIEQTVKEDDRA